MSVFEKGELIRIKETGEVFTYELGSGGANFSTYVTVTVAKDRFRFDLPLLWLADVEKVDINGNVIDDFSQYAGI